MCRRPRTGRTFSRVFLTGTLAAFGLGTFTAAYLMSFFAPNRMLGAFGVVVSPGGNRCFVAGLDGCVGDILTSFFMSLVPHHFCAGDQGTGAEHEAGLFHSGDGDHRRRLTPAMGLIAEAARRSRACIPRSTRRICLSHGLCLSRRYPGPQERCCLLQRRYGCLMQTTILQTYIQAGMHEGLGPRGSQPFVPCAMRKHHTPSCDLLLHHRLGEIPRPVHVHSVLPGQK